MTGAHDTRPVLFAYDGSELATHAIEQAGQLLATTRPALVATIWQPFDVGFVPTAAAGAAHAQNAGFQAQSIALEAAPTWKALVKLAEQHDATIIVLGSHSRSGIAGVVLGSVAASVAAHSPRSVLIVHRDA